MKEYISLEIFLKNYIIVKNRTQYFKNVIKETFVFRYRNLVKIQVEF